MMLPQCKKNWSNLRNQQGSYLIMTAITLTAIFGMAALGVEVGRWYAIQGELGKAIDGAAFAGAQHINNPNIPDKDLFVRQVAQANFPNGMLGTDTATFVVNDDGNGKITVDGSVNSLNTLAKGFNASYDKTAVGTSGSAKLRTAEIALILDVSGSMNGTPLDNLIDGAKHFVENFEDHEATSKFALTTFASGVVQEYPMGHNFMAPLTTAINGLDAEGGTNTEDAIGQAEDFPWTDQSALPANERGKQVVVFFSDGNPTAFRGTFGFEGQDNIDGVLAITGEPGDWNVYQAMQDPDVQFEVQNFANPYSMRYTGDGLDAGTVCPQRQEQWAWDNGWVNNQNVNSMRWEIFDDAKYGLDTFVDTIGIDPLQCGIGEPNPLAFYADDIIRRMAVDHAQNLKDMGIEIYTIGLGDVDQNFLESLSSGAGFAYYTNDPTQLAGIFQQIANILKLVLVN